jgi:hypothetical protein
MTVSEDTPSEGEDDRLIERLRAIALEADPPPTLVTAAAEAALLTRRLDTELALLVADSGGELPRLARGEDEQVRMLTFEAASVVIELEIRSAGSTGGSLSLRGLVTGAAGEVVVETGNPGSPAGTVRRAAALNAEGWFTMDGLESGVLRLHVPTAGGAVTTSWVTF